MYMYRGAQTQLAGESTEADAKIPMDLHNVGKVQAAFNGTINSVLTAGSGRRCTGGYLQKDGSSRLLLFLPSLGSGCAAMLASLAVGDARTAASQQSLALAYLLL